VNRPMTRAPGKSRMLTLGSHRMVLLHSPLPLPNGTEGGDAQPIGPAAVGLAVAKRKRGL
jgi:hypothetical protein